MTDAESTIYIDIIGLWLGNNASIIKVAIICITFPLVGHSFLPSNKDFGRIEKDIKKEITIFNQDNNTNIFFPRKNSLAGKYFDFKKPWKNDWNLLLSGNFFNKNIFFLLIQNRAFSNTKNPIINDMFE